MHGFADEEKINKLHFLSDFYHQKLNQFHGHYVNAKREQHSVERMEIVGLIFQMCVCNLDFVEAFKQASTHSFTGYAAKAAVRPVVLRAYEIQLAMGQWSKRLKDLADKFNAGDIFVDYKNAKAENRDLIKKLRSMSDVRNTIGHSGSDPHEFISVIDGIDVLLIEKCCVAMLDCHTGMINAAIAVLAHVPTR